MKRIVTLLLAFILTVCMLPASLNVPASAQTEDYLLLEDFEAGIDGYWGGDLSSFNLAPVSYTHLQAIQNIDWDLDVRGQARVDEMARALEAAIANQQRAVISG